MFRKANLNERKASLLNAFREEEKRNWHSAQSDGLKDECKAAVDEFMEEYNGENEDFDFSGRIQPLVPLQEHLVFPKLQQRIKRSLWKSVGIMLVFLSLAGNLAYGGTQYQLFWCVLCLLYVTAQGMAFRNHLLNYRAVKN